MARGDVTKFRGSRSRARVTANTHSFELLATKHLCFADHACSPHPTLLKLMSSTTPSWPSLYNPGLEILHIDHDSPVQPGGAYLYRANGVHCIDVRLQSIDTHEPADIFRFTFYWTLIFYTPFFFVCGFYAFCNYAFPPQHTPYQLLSLPSHQSREDSSSIDREHLAYGDEASAYVPLQPLHSPHSPLALRATPTSQRSTVKTHKKNERRSRVTLAILVLLIFLAFGLAGAVIGSAVLGFAVMGLYRAAHFNMST